MGTGGGRLSLRFACHVSKNPSPNMIVGFDLLAERAYVPTMQLVAF